MARLLPSVLLPTPGQGIPEGHPCTGILQTLYPLESLCDRWGVSPAECDSVSGRRRPGVLWALL